MLGVFEAFSGIGAQVEALKKLSENYGFEYESVGVSEVDKHAMKTYNAIHGETRNFGDITQIDTSELPDMDLFTYSFPCQDISIVGRQLGMKEGTGTKSSLLWECYRLIKDKRPKYLLMENVKNLVKKANIEDFERWLEGLRELGYTNYWDILKGSDYGVPQGRERVFCVSILKTEEVSFKFPSPFPLEKTFIDIVCEEEASKYIVPTNILESYLGKKPPFGNRFAIREEDDIAFTLTAKSGRAVITNNYLCNHVLKEKRGKPCLREILDNGYTVRALGPREYWRLMGFSDEAYDKASEVTSEAQLYKQAGNSIIVDVLYYIFEELFIKNR